MKQNIMKLVTGISVGCVLSTGIWSALPAYAAIGYDRGSYEVSDQEAESSGGWHTVTDGTVQLGSGNGSIVLNGTDHLSLLNKKFEVIQLFDCAESEDHSSIKYTFHEPYKEAVQKSVYREMSRKNLLTAAERSAGYTGLTEQRAVDYIQSLNPAKGTDSTQTENGYESDFRYFVEDLRTEIKVETLAGTFVKVDTLKDGQNSITLSGLDYGYYMLDERFTDDQPEYDAMSLLMVNTVSPSVSMTLKADLPTVTKQIQEDDANAYKLEETDGWNDIGDYEIGQIIPYRYTTAVPDMNGMTSYYYAFHDRADSALTPYLSKTDDTKTNQKAAAVRIVKKNAAGEEQVYQLTDQEFDIELPGSENKKPDGKTSRVDDGDTFVIAIPDLKEITDREFPGTRADGLHDYSDMTLEVTYQAVLNENAANDTGRPGFENDVRLEFSNDYDIEGYDSTGYTPWDTVTAFTFRLDALKTNSKDQKLENAHFRLYSDASLTQEVLVKRDQNASGQTYVVVNRDSVGGNDHTGGDTSVGEEMISDENGSIIICGLDQGTYYVKETEAPDGYRLLDQPITLTVTPSYADEARNSYVKGTGSGDTVLTALSASADGKNLTTDVSEGSAKLKIVNETGSRLPMTGSSVMLLLIGGGALLTGGSFLMNRKEKHRKE